MPSLDIRPLSPLDSLRRISPRTHLRRADSYSWTQTSPTEPTNPTTLDPFPLITLSPPTADARVRSYRPDPAIIHVYRSPHPRPPNAFFGRRP